MRPSDLGNNITLCTDLVMFNVSSLNLKENSFSLHSAVTVPMLANAVKPPHLPRGKDQDCCPRLESASLSSLSLVLGSAVSVYTSGHLWESQDCPQEADRWCCGPVLRMEPGTQSESLFPKGGQKAPVTYLRASGEDALLRCMTVEITAILKGSPESWWRLRKRFHFPPNTI